MLRQFTSRVASSTPLAQLRDVLGVPSSLLSASPAAAAARAAVEASSVRELSTSSIRSTATTTATAAIASSSGRSSNAVFDSSVVPRSFSNSCGASASSSWSIYLRRRRGFATDEGDNNNPARGLNPLLRAPGPLAPPPPGDASTTAAATTTPDIVIPSASLASPASTTALLSTVSKKQQQQQLRARAVLRNVRISPKKLARFAKLVSGMHVDDALAQCSVAREAKAAALCRGVIASAAANARNNHGNLRGGGGEEQSGSDRSHSGLRVAAAVVGRAPTPTRPWYHGKGRTGVRHIYRSHLTIELEATSKPPLTRFQRPLLERQGKGRPPVPTTERRRRRSDDDGGGNNKVSAAGAA